MSRYNDDDDMVVDREGGFYGGSEYESGNFVVKNIYKVGKTVVGFIHPASASGSSSNLVMGVGVLVVLALLYIVITFFLGQYYMYSGYMGSSFDSVKSDFMNTRHAPYFPDVSNRVLRREDREHEAIRALAKINQERTRRTEGGSDSGPLAWGPFWQEWQLTRPNDDPYSEFADEEGFSEATLGNKL